MNIENIYKCKTLKHGSPNLLSVSTIAKQTSLRPKSFNVDMLMQKREIKRKKILDNFTEMYEQCVRKIEIANDLNKTDLLFCVKNHIPDCPDYDPDFCVDYIRNKLHDLHFDTYKINNTTIFITWLYMETNKLS